MKEFKRNVNPELEELIRKWEKNLAFYEIIDHQKYLLIKEFLKDLKALPKQ